MFTPRKKKSTLIGIGIGSFARLFVALQISAGYKDAVLQTRGRMRPKPGESLFVYTACTHIELSPGCDGPSFSPTHSPPHANVMLNSTPDHHRPACHEHSRFGLRAWFKDTLSLSLALSLSLELRHTRLCMHIYAMVYVV